VDFGGFNDWNYTLAGISSFLCVVAGRLNRKFLTSMTFSIFYALFIPHFYIEVFANFQGIAPEISKYQLAILNAFGIPARIIPGLVADRVGP
jgi:hypothetical protein